MKRAAAVLLGLIVLTLAMIVYLSAAHAAQLQCGPLPLLLKQLAARYHEFVVMSANNADGANVLVTRSDKGNGKGACVILAGDKAEFDNGT